MHYNIKCHQIILLALENLDANRIRDLTIIYIFHHDTKSRRCNSLRYNTIRR